MRNNNEGILCKGFTKLGSLVDLFIRVVMFHVFFTSAWHKWNNWDETLKLFQTDYAVSFLTPHTAALIGTGAEMIFAVLLLVGLFSRISALALLAINFLTSVYYMLFINKEHYFTNYLWAAYSIMLLAGIIWVLDRTNVVCSPDSIFQGHALWHMLTAASIFFIYLYYRSGVVPLDDVIAERNERRALRK